MQCKNASKWINNLFLSTTNQIHTEVRPGIIANQFPQHLKPGYIYFNKILPFDKEGYYKIESQFNLKVIYNNLKYTVAGKH